MILFFVSAIIYLICAFSSNAARNWMTHHHRPGPRLDDLGFRLIPELGDEYFWVSERLMDMFFLFYFPPVVMAYSTTLIEVGHLLSILYILRTISFLSTFLPSPASHAKTEPAEKGPLTWRKMWLTFNMTKGRGDLLFSGHCLHSYVILQAASFHLPAWCITLGWISFLIQIYFIIACRKHYTVDILVALYVCSLVWHWYQASVKPLFFE